VGSRTTISRAAEPAEKERRTQASASPTHPHRNATARYALREKPLDHRDAHQFHAKTPPDERFSPLLGQKGRSGCGGSMAKTEGLGADRCSAEKEMAGTKDYS
jgi:hypothetical protein